MRIHEAARGVAERHKPSHTRSVPCFPALLQAPFHCGNGLVADVVFHLADIRRRGLSIHTQRREDLGQSLMTFIDLLSDGTAFFSKSDVDAEQLWLFCGWKKAWKVRLRRLRLLRYVPSDLPSGAAAESCAKRSILKFREKSSTRPPVKTGSRSAFPASFRRAGRNGKMFRQN